MANENPLRPDTVLTARFIGGGLTNILSLHYSIAPNRRKDGALTQNQCY
jgi:hypothetical protein